MLTVKELRSLADKTTPADAYDALRRVIPGNAETERVITGLSMLGEGQFFAKPVTVNTLPSRPDFVAEKEASYRTETGFGDPLTHAASLCDDDSALVIDSSGHFDSSVFGGMKSSTAAALGAVAIVTDGLLRDKQDFEEFYERFGMKTFSSGWAVRIGTRLAVFGHEVNVPVSVKGVLVQPTDYLFGNVNGILVIPGDYVEEILILGSLITKEYGMIAEKIRNEKLLYGKDIGPSPATKEMILDEYGSAFSDREKVFDKYFKSA